MNELAGKIIQLNLFQVTRDATMSMLNNVKDFPAFHSAHANCFSIKHSHVHNDIVV